MDAINRFGTTLLNLSFAQEAQYYLNNQRFTFGLPVSQLKKNGTFNLNYALTADPKIHNGVMDLSLFMDIGPEGNHCILS